VDVVQLGLGQVDGLALALLDAAGFAFEYRLAGGGGRFFVRVFACAISEY